MAKAFGGANTKDEKYIDELKHTIMDMVFDYAKHVCENADEIIAAWFEQNEKATKSRWSQMDKMSVRDLWGMMLNRVEI